MHIQPKQSAADVVATPGPLVSIVVRSYNEGRFIRRLFVGIANQTYPNIEVILIDSGSNDETVSIAEEYGARIVHIRKADFSFGRSLNLGCAAARGEFLVFASAHVYPTRTDWIERLIEPFAHERVALVYGKQRGNEVTRFSEHQIFRQWFPDEDEDNQSHHFCNNANCAIRRSWWQRFSYDEMLTGLEDLAWAKEAMRQGARISYAAQAEIIHVHDESWSRIRNRYYREAIALKQIEPSLSFGAGHFLWLMLSNIVYDLHVAVRQGAMRREALGIILFRANQFWGTYKGYRFDAPLTREVKNRFYFAPPKGKAPEEPHPRVKAEAAGASQIDYSKQ